MKKLVCVALVAGLGMSGLAQADEALMKKSGCVGCHAMDKKLLGPSFQDIAAKYKGDKAAPAMLEAKILDGGKGNWGSVAMPAQKPKVTPEGAKSIVAWILSLK